MPLSIITSPPLPIVDAPLDSTRSPAVSEFESPDLIVTSPDEPSDAEPDHTSTEPLIDSAAPVPIITDPDDTLPCPVSTYTLPDAAPRAIASAVARDNLPDSKPAPVDKSIDPPSPWPVTPAEN
jgi:hypothetical protein